MNGLNGKSERAWCEVRTSDGVAQLHVSDGNWEVWVKTDAEGDLKLSARGSVFGAGTVDGGGVVPFAPAPPRVLVVGDLRVEVPTRAVSFGGEEIRLSNKEFALLVALAAEPSRVFTKAELLRDVWGFRSQGRTRTLDSHASRLRRKLALAGGENLVVNCWGVGYRLVDAADVAPAIA